MLQGLWIFVIYVCKRNIYNLLKADITGQKIWTGIGTKTTGFQTNKFNSNSRSRANSNSNVNSNSKSGIEMQEVALSGNNVEL